MVPASGVIDSQKFPLLFKAASRRYLAGDVAREIDPLGKRPGFRDEMSDVVDAVSNKQFFELPKEMSEAALAGQTALAKVTGTNMPLVGADRAVEDAKKKRLVWQREFARYRIPFSDEYLVGGGDFGRPDMVQAAFRAAGKEIDEKEALRISVRMSQVAGQRDRDTQLAKAAAFRMPENPGVVDETDNYKLSAGANDWESSHTWVWVDFRDYRGDTTRLWFQVKYPDGTTCADDYDPKTKTSEQHQAELNAGKAHGDKAWKAWLATAKKCIKVRKDENGFGRHRSKFDWERGFRDALTHEDMKPFVADHGELVSEFREKKAGAPPIEAMRAIIARAAKLKSQLGPDAADRYTMEHLGSVFRIAKKRLSNQALKAPPPAVMEPPAPQGPLAQASFPFFKQSCLKAQLRRARNITHTHPTPGQARAGNYSKGELSIHGMPVKIENPKGTERRGYDKDGNVTWRRIMAADYGYFKGSKAIDGDAVDCFIGPDPESHFVVAIDQKKADGSFDETKFVLGCTTQEQAEKLYLAHYPRGWNLGPVSTTTVQQLKEWLKNGQTKAPFKGQMVKAAKLIDPRAFPTWTIDAAGGVSYTPGDPAFLPEKFRRGEKQAKDYGSLLRNLRLRRGECPDCGKPNVDPYPDCGCGGQEKSAAEYFSASKLRGDYYKVANDAFDRAVEAMPEGSDKEMAKKGHGIAMGSCGCKIRGCKCPSRMHNIKLTLDIPCKDCAAEKSAVVKQDAETGKWVLWTKDESRKLGTHDTPDEAYAQEYAIQKSQERKVKPAPGMADRFHRNLKKALGQEKAAGVQPQTKIPDSIIRLRELLPHVKRLVKVSFSGLGVTASKPLPPKKP